MHLCLHIGLSKHQHCLPRLKAKQNLLLGSRKCYKAKDTQVLLLSQLIHIGTTYRSCKCIQNLNSLALSRLSPIYQSPTRQNIQIKVQWDFKQVKILHHWIMTRSFEHEVQVVQIFIKNICLRWPGNLQVKVTWYSATNTPHKPSWKSHACYCSINTPHKLSYLKLLL